MELGNREDRTVAAGEYVLGLLEPADRRAFEQAAQSDASLNDEVRGWERRLAVLATRLAPVVPRPIVWLNILHAMEPARASAPARTRFTSAWATFATAASLVLGFALYRQMSLPPPAPVIVTERVPVTAEAYVASFKAPRQGEWMVSIVPGTHKVRAVAGAEKGMAANNDPELWLITDAGPVSLGLLPKTGEVEHELPAGLPAVQGRTVAVSLEPLGGSKTRGPSGPVIGTATLLRVS